MMSQLLRTVLVVAVICYFSIIVQFLKKRTLSLKYSLLWIFSGIIMGILVAFPGLLDLFVMIVDIRTPVNGLFALCIFFIIIITMSLTSIVSKQNDKIKNLVQDNALLEVRVRELEGKDIIQRENRDNKIGYQKNDIIGD